MPVKTKRSFHKGHEKEKHTKRFIKVYAPYLPLLFIVSLGLFLSTTSSLKRLHTNNVLAYATNISDDGLLDATNKERVANGLQPLRYSIELDKAAAAKAEDMSKRNYWSHNTPDGQEPWYFITQSNYSYFKAAENLAYGFDTSKGTVIGWMNSPSHRANVLDKELQEVGFGIVNVPNYLGNGPETIVVAMYGSVATTTPGAVSNVSDPLKPAQTSPLTNASPEQKKISYAQALTGGSAPWISLAIGIVIGLSGMYLVLRHARNLGRIFKKGERFILHHPLLDTTLIALMALATVVAQTAGVIH